MIRPLGRDLPARFRAAAMVGAGAHQRAGCAARAQQRREPLADTAFVRENQPRGRVGGEPGLRQRGLRLPCDVIERVGVRGNGSGGSERSLKQVRKGVQHVLGVLARRLEVLQRFLDAAGIHADDGRRRFLQTEALPLERVVRQGRGGLGLHREQCVPVELRALHIQRRECALQCIAGAWRRQPAVGEPLRRGPRLGLRLGLIRQRGKLQPVLWMRYLVGQLGAETAGNQTDRGPCEGYVLKRGAQGVGIRPGCDEAQRVGNAHDPRHAGRDIFSDAVARHDGRADAPCLPQFRPRELDREAALIGIECRQRHRATREGVAEKRFGRVEFACDADVRRTEHEADAQRLARACRCRRRFPHARHIGRAKRIMGPPRGGGPADGGQFPRRRAGDRALVALCERRERRFGPGRQQQQRALRGVGRRDGRFLDDRVCIGAAESERAHPGDSPAFPAPPRDRVGRHANGDVLPRRMRIGLREMQMRRDPVVLERQQHLDQAGDAGGRLQMPDIGLDRTDHERLGRLAPGAVDAGQRLDLDRVAEGRPRTVGLDIGDVAGHEAGLIQCATDHPFLRIAARHGQPAARTALIDRRATDDTEHAVAVGERVGQALEHHHAATFAAHIAVRRRVEGLAPAVRRQHARLRETDHHLGRKHQVDAACKRHVAFARAQAFASQVQTDQRRRAGGIDRHARAGEAQHERQAARGHVQRAARAGVAARRRRRIGHLDRMVEAGNADIHARGGLPEAFGREMGVFERFPGHFEQEPLLRVEVSGFARRDSEERRVEFIHAFEKRAVAGRHLAGRGRIRVVIAIDVPAFARHFGDGIARVIEQLPERGRRIAAAGESASHADDGDRLVAVRTQRRDFRAPQAQFVERGFQCMRGLGVHLLLRETPPLMAGRKGGLLTGSFFHRLGWPA
ncbi:hypothetical protein BamIOP4010DRAFT_5583 [Burkholderia ambifaria IOP40-10]|uniref:Uncharacterized protein n=1 Tax=Burkholderia ambifaria IOP40-10 TaxID=396596 RepID=B1FNH2_9BURK|nr:hypothetical protein BamIOP4010DRAFT_5583 [Burkholderia ambifaria IOP40-10]